MANVQRKETKFGPSSTKFHPRNGESMNERNSAKNGGRKSPEGGKGKCKSRKRTWESICLKEKLIEKVCPNPLRYQCTVCGNQVNPYCNIRYHFNYQDVHGIFKCKGDMQVEKQFKCPVCPERFETPAGFKYHAGGNHGSDMTIWLKISKPFKRLVRLSNAKNGSRWPYVTSRFDQKKDEMSDPKAKKPRYSRQAEEMKRSSS